MEELKYNIIDLMEHVNDNSLCWMLDLCLIFSGPAVVEDLVKVLWEILTREQLDAQTINNLVIPMVDIIYGYSECLSLQQGQASAASESVVAPAVALLRKLLFAPYEAVRTSCR